MKALSQSRATEGWNQVLPAANYAFTGPASGPGAAMAWAGNNHLGEGRLTITENRPAERVAMRLEFVRPFACDNTVEFTFQRAGEQTVATWCISGRCNFFAKAMHLFISMDRMVGGQFDEGLGNLKALAGAAVRK